MADTFVDYRCKVIGLWFYFPFIAELTVSRFFNRMDEDTLNQFLAIGKILRKRVYSIQMPQDVILDLDSTLLDAYGKQEGRAFNFNYQGYI